MANPLHWHPDLPLGVSDIEPDAASRYSPRIGNAMIRGEEIRCCVKGCDNWLPRVRRGKSALNSYCPTHGIRMSARPTYVYQSKCRNLIVGRDLLRSITKVESWRLGNENSEDALSWNVCVSFLKAGAIDELFTLLTGSGPTASVGLYLWGNRVSSDGGISRWSELLTVCHDLEEGLSLPTEPDMALVVPGDAVVLIEAKFGSGNSTLEGRESRFGGIRGFLDRYQVEPGYPEPLRRDEIASHKPTEVPEQLCRNIIFAARLARRMECTRAMVINLVRESQEPDIEERMRRCISEDVVRFKRQTWERVLDLAKSIGTTLEPLCAYMENKTLCLRRAFPA